MSDTSKAWEYLAKRLERVKFTPRGGVDQAHVVLTRAEMALIQGALHAYYGDIYD